MGYWGSWVGSLVSRNVRYGDGGILGSSGVWSGKVWGWGLEPVEFDKTRWYCSWNCEHQLYTKNLRGWGGGDLKLETLAVKEKYQFKVNRLF